MLFFIVKQEVVNIMDSNSFNKLSNLEFEPLYHEVEFILTQLDDDTDPLGDGGDHSPIDWHLIKAHTDALLGKGNDLRVILWRLRAGLQLDGISALYQCMVKLDKLAAEISLHKSDGEASQQQETQDDIFYASALGWLATHQCIGACKRARLTPESTFSMNALLNNESHENKVPFAEVVSELKMADHYYDTCSYPDLLTQIKQSLFILERVEESVNQSSEDYRLNCQNLHVFLEKLSLYLASLAPNGKECISSDLDDGAVNPPNKQQVYHTTELSSRNDVIGVLDTVIRYFQNYEPSHPAPLFIRRAQKIIGMDFETIIEELLPDSIDSLQQFTGKNKDNNLTQ